MDSRAKGRFEFPVLAACNVAYAGYVEKPCVRKYLLVALAFVLGLMAKPMLVTLPFALLLLDFWPLDRVKIREGGRELWTSCWPLVWEKVPLFVLSATFSVVVNGPETGRRR